MQFKRAERKKAKLRLAMCAPSGAGKTYSALLIAMGMGGRTAMIDTEFGSGELYADLCEYDVLQLSPPYTPAKYIQAIKAAEDAGYDYIIIDSLTHAWAGEGGLLEEVDNKSKGKANSFAAWRDNTPLHNQLVNAMLNSKCHILATMRSKVAYELQKNDRGKMAPVKMGLAPVQREGMDYEFTVVFDLSIEGHYATASKDRTSIFDGQTFVPTIETGEKLIEWLNTGAEPPKLHDLDMVEFELKNLNTVDELNTAMGELGVPEGHPQRAQALSMYSRVKSEIETRATLNAPVNRETVVRIQAMYSETNIKDRDLNLQDIATRLNIDIPSSTNDLTQKQAENLIESLKQG